MLTETTIREVIQLELSINIVYNKLKWKQLKQGIYVEACIWLLRRRTTENVRICQLRLKNIISLLLIVSRFFASSKSHQMFDWCDSYFIPISWGSFWDELLYIFVSWSLERLENILRVYAWFMFGLIKSSKFRPLISPQHERRQSIPPREH